MLGLMLVFLPEVREYLDGVLAFGAWLVGWPLAGAAVGLLVWLVGRPILAAVMRDERRREMILGGLAGAVVGLAIGWFFGKLNPGRYEALFGGLIGAGLGVRLSLFMLPEAEEES